MTAGEAAPPADEAAPGASGATGGTARPRAVMHLITGLGVGGAERALINLVNREMADGEMPVVVSLRSPEHFFHVLRRRGVAVRSLRVDRPRHAFAGVIALARMLRRERPDVLTCWMYHANVIGLLALLASGLRRRTRLVWGIRCSDMDLRAMLLSTRIAARLGAWLSPLADALVVNSHAGAAVHRRLGYRTDPTIVIPNGFDGDAFAPDEAAGARLRRELGLAEDAVMVGMVARADPMKNYPAFFAAARALPQLQFVAVGTGTERFGGPPNLRGLGARSDMAGLLNAFDIVALTSAYGEGMSNAIGEAMATGRAIVATDVGDAGRMLAGGAGRVVPPRDHDALVAAIAAFAEDPAARRAAGATARERVRTHYAIDRNVTAFREVLQDTGEAAAVPAPDTDAEADETADAAIGDDADNAPAHRSAGRGRLRTLGVAARTLISVGLLAALLAYIDFSVIYAHLTTVGERPGPFAAACLGFLAQVGLVSLRLQVMFRAMGTRLGYLKVAAVAVSSAIANALVAMSGVLVRLLLSVEDLVPVRRIVLLFIVERVMVLAALCLFCLPMLWIALSGGAPAALLEAVESFPELRLGILAAAAAALLAGIAGAAVALRVSPRTARMLRAVREELSIMVRDGKTLMLGAVGLSLVGQAVSVASTVLLAQSLGYDGSFLVLGLLVPLPMVLAALPIAMGGWGVREAVFVFVLGAVLGVPQGLALTLSILVGLLSLLALLLWQLGLLGVTLVWREDAARS